MEPARLMREEILDGARKATCGDRDRQYGKPETNFNRIAILWNAHLEVAFGSGAARLAAEDVCWMLSQVKQARAIHGFNLDNYVDGAGYIACGGEVAARMLAEGLNGRP
jgi:hypothetical protein